jgi:hypothetical protein
MLGDEISARKQAESVDDLDEDDGEKAERKQRSHDVTERVAYRHARFPRLDPFSQVATAH